MQGYQYTSKASNEKYFQLRLTKRNKIIEEFNEQNRCKNQNISFWVNAAKQFVNENRYYKITVIQIEDEYQPITWRICKISRSGIQWHGFTENLQSEYENSTKNSIAS